MVSHACPVKLCRVSTIHCSHVKSYLRLNNGRWGDSVDVGQIGPINMTHDPFIYGILAF